MWRSRTGRGLRRRVETSGVIACLVLLSIGTVATRAGAHGAGKDAGATGGICHAMGTQDEVAPDKLPVPQKMSGIGNVHIKITATPEARAWFDQGLNLYHDFWDYESARAFEQGVRVDSQCAMCYWGLYLAETFRRSPSKHFADEALAKAVSLKGHASKAERLYIEASAAHEAAEKDKKDADEEGDSKDVQILRKLVKRNPKDTQARIFLAESVLAGYDDDGKPRKGTVEALTILQGVMKDEPENSAANHYWIHAVEASPRPEQALTSAGMLGRLAPTSGHMVHMPGHIYYRTGDYARARQSFAASMRADEQYMQGQHVQVDDDWNYVHNMMYAIANLMEEGQLAEATVLSAKLKEARGELEATLYPWSPRDSMTRLDPRLPVALRAGDWARASELLKASEVPPAQLSNLGFLARALTDFAAGMQALDAGEIAKAEEASQRLDAELWRISDQLKADEDAKAKDKKAPADAGMPKMQVMPDAHGKPLVSNVSIMSLELRAGLLVAKKQTDDAKKLYAQAAREEKDLGYHEPPGYIRPVAETQAAAMLSASAWTDAKAAYQKALVERPKSGFPLYGIALSSERAGDAKTASAEYAEFVAAWKDADSGLPELTHARAFLAEHGSAVAAAK
jgi:tetratricopeptide (TPR) repeat protein